MRSQYRNYDRLFVLGCGARKMSSFGNHINSMARAVFGTLVLVAVNLHIFKRYPKIGKALQKPMTATWLHWELRAEETEQKIEEREIKHKM